MEMNDLKDIIDLQCHPLGDATYATRCRSKFQNFSILVLKNFLRKDALVNLQAEASALQGKAFYCSQNHNVLLTEKNAPLGEDYACNMEVTSDKGCVPHDLIPHNSCLRTIYNSSLFQKFIESVVSIDKIHPYADTLSSINYNYYEENQQLGWHFDNASFAITLTIESPASGGDFQYVRDARKAEKNTVNNQLINSVLQNKHPIEKLQTEETMLVLFNGRNNLHRVTPVTSKKHRVLVTLNYNLEENIELSENARMTFFGRLN